MQFRSPVKFLGTEVKTGTNARGPWSMNKAYLFVPDVGRVEVLVNGSPALPPVDSMVNLRLSPVQGKFQALQLVWDERSQCAPVK